MVIVVPFGVAVVLAIIGVVFWIIDKAVKAKRMAERHAAKVRLNADLRAPAAAEQLPYGFSQKNTTGDAEGSGR
jgi:hypothetical protein